MTNKRYYISISHWGLFDVTDLFKTGQIKLKDIIEMIVL